MSGQDYSKMLVAELKQELSKFGLPTSGNKELIERLESNASEPLMISIEADLVEDESSYEAIIAKMNPSDWTIESRCNHCNFHFTADGFINGVLKPAWLGFGADYDYELIDFDQSN